MTDFEGLNIDFEMVVVDFKGFVLMSSLVDAEYWNRGSIDGSMLMGVRSMVRCRGSLHEIDVE